MNEENLNNGGVRRKVHITLVGGQLAPGYNAIKATTPDIVEVVYSEQTKNDIEVLRDVINIHIEDSKPLSATNLHEILDRAKDLAEKYADDDVTLNITSGTKSWSHLFAATMLNARVIYFDQNNVLWDFSELTSRKCDFDIDFATHFKLYKNPLKDSAKLDDYDENDAEVAENIEKIWRNYAYRREFSDLTNNLNQTEENEKRKIKPDGSYVKWDKNTDDENYWVEINIANAEAGDFPRRFESRHAKSLVLNAGWFEYKVAKLFSRWGKCKGIILNGVFKYDDSGNDKNEVDVIVKTDNKLIFVECKTTIRQNKELDKFANVVRKYGGTGSKGLFITAKRKHSDTIEKCKENGFILPNCYYWPNFNERKFFESLEQELDKLNP